MVSALQKLYIFLMHNRGSLIASFLHVSLQNLALYTIVPKKYKHKHFVAMLLAPQEIIAFFNAQPKFTHSLFFTTSPAKFGLLQNKCADCFSEKTNLVWQGSSDFFFKFG